jgi:hypothetical protein
MRFLLKLVLVFVLVLLFPNVALVAFMGVGSVGTALHDIFANPIHAIGQLLIATGTLLLFGLYCLALYRLGMSIAKDMGRSRRRSRPQGTNKTLF